MSLSAYLRSSFLRVSDVEETTTRVIAECKEHTFTPKDGSTPRTSLCLFFTDGQALSLSQHHLRKLMELGYEEEEELVGLSIVLDRGQAEYNGENVEAITITKVV